MEQAEFLENKVFTGLKNLNDKFDKEPIHYFSEADFEIILQRVEYFGIGIYTVNALFNGKPYGVVAHEDVRKKATDSKWYKKAFLTFKSKQVGLVYWATYKVSTKLLARSAN